eukprot:g2552.t1
MIDSNDGAVKAITPVHQIPLLGFSEDLQRDLDVERARVEELQAELAARKVAHAEEIAQLKNEHSLAMHELKTKLSLENTMLQHSTAAEIDQLKQIDRFEDEDFRTALRRTGFTAVHLRQNQAVIEEMEIKQKLEFDSLLVEVRRLQHLLVKQMSLEKKNKNTKKKNRSKTKGMSNCKKLTINTTDKEHPHSSSSLMEELKNSFALGLERLDFKKRKKIN